MTSSLIFREPNKVYLFKTRGKKKIITFTILQLTHDYV